MLIFVPIILFCFNSVVDAILRKRSDDENPTVITPLGVIKGSYGYLEFGVTYSAYEGIPYAMPPVGELRFEPPEQIKKWKGTLYATDLKSDCAQIKPILLNGTKQFIGSEDCLYLNIYTPRESDEYMPVVVWIHGGSFKYGSGTETYGYHLLKYNIVFVTINYRLGPLGFLSTQDSYISGNMGLKDQSMALRWIQANIRTFNGDPEKITLAGVGAGAASVHLHYLSSLSRGLFRGGISMSGTALNPWVITKEPLMITKKLARLVRCSVVELTHMIYCLKDRPVRQILEIADQLAGVISSRVFFGPVVEQLSDKITSKPFLHRHPLDILIYGDVQDSPWITSVTKADGFHYAADFLTTEYFGNKFNINWNTLAPQIFEYNHTLLSRSMDYPIAYFIKEFYFGIGQINNIDTFAAMASDRLYRVPSVKAVQRQFEINKRPIWHYYFAYQGEQSTCETIYGVNKKHGPCLGDDAAYVISSDTIDSEQSFEDYKMQLKLIELWVYFIKNNKAQIPGVRWNKVNATNEELQFLAIGKDYEFTMLQTFDFGYKNWWEKLRLDRRN